MSRWLLSLVVGCLACGEDGTRLQVSFADEISGARARSLDVVVTPDLTCGQISDQRFDDVVAAVGRAETLPLPIPENARPLGRAESGSVVAVGARDAEGLVLGRGCEPLDGPAGSVSVRLRPRPRCSREPTGLDLALVLDASGAMQRADIGLEGAVRPALVEEIATAPLPGDGELRLVVAKETTETIGPGRERVADALAELSLEGSARLWDGLLSAARGLRHDARCPRAAAILVVAAGGGGTQSPEGAVEVSLSLSGADADLEDDIFGFGLALDDPGLDALVASLPFSRVVGPLRSPTAYRFQLREARRALAARLP